MLEIQSYAWVLFFCGEFVVAILFLYFFNLNKKEKRRENNDK